MIDESKFWQIKINMNLVDWDEIEIKFFEIDYVLLMLYQAEYVYTVCRSSFRNLYDISNPALWMPATLMS